MQIFLNFKSQEIVTYGMVYKNSVFKPQQTRFEGGPALSKPEGQRRW